MAYTRRDFTPGVPQVKVAKFSTGVASQDYDYSIQLTANERGQIRHNSLEAARVAANKKLVQIGEGSYHLLVKVYPHVILRENKMIATAGADRLQEGMRKAFGKPIGLAARVEVGSVILELSVKEEHLDKAKEALKAAATKLPVPCSLTAATLKTETLTPAP